MVALLERQQRVLQTSVIGRLRALLILVLACLSQVWAQDVHDVVVYVDSVKQVIRGFGAANILLWRPEMTANEIQKAFGTGPGEIGLSLLRLRIPPETDGFAVNVSNAQAAHAMGVTIIASPWSPPAAMKTNNSTISGRLRETSYAEYAAHLKSFVEYMASNGVPLYAVSVQNEPDIQVNYESCDWNATEMVNFIKEYGDSVGTRLIAPESFQFIPTMANAILNDSAATAHVEIIGGHIYGGGLTAYPLATQKGKEFWMTEHLDTNTSWTNVLATGKEILDCLNAGMNAYIWWYIVRFYGPIGDGEMGSMKGSVTKRGYIMSQFARFIRPGDERIAPTNPVQRPVYVTAGKSDSKIVIVVVNNGPSVEQTIRLENVEDVDYIATPYVTSLSKNCEQGGNVTVSDGGFTVTLDGSSVTTFVLNDTSSSDEVPEIPSSFSLSQNYPNPFNPTTVIEYKIPLRSHVTLTVFDVLGREIATLVNAERSPGVYHEPWDASGVPSGLYLYKLEAGTFVDTRKMLLVR